MRAKKVDNKPYFRSIAKRAAYEILLRDVQSKSKMLRANKLEIVCLSKENGQLKKDLAALHQLLAELTAGLK